jgi:hypothetical protein
MEGTGIVRDQEVGRRTNGWRIAAGVALLVLLALLAVLLTPPYYENWKLQRYLSALAHDPASAHRSSDLLRALVVDKAAGMGIPVRTGDVHVTQGPNSTRIEVLYVIHIDLPVHTVDLHFRPAAAAR